MIDEHDDELVANQQLNSPEFDEADKQSLLRDRVLLGAVVGAFVLDQVSKRIVTSTLSLHESWPSSGFFRITHGTNSGTAFGLLPNQTTLLIVASLVAIGFLVYFYRTHAMPSMILRFAIGLQLGGAFGNLIDRVFAGKVVDFIDVGPWPIFNLADSSIVVGIFILMTTFMFTKDPDSEPSDDLVDNRADTGEVASAVSSSTQDE
jgi:signal peptidase II